MSASARSPLRVGIDAWGMAGAAHRTGMGQYTAALLRELPRAGVSVFAYGAPGEPRPDWLPRATEWRGGGRARVGKLSAVEHRLFELSRAVEQDRIDVFHAPGVHVRPSFPPVPRVGVPLVVTMHDAIPLSYYGRALPARTRAFYRWNVRRVARADRVLTVSEHARRDIAAHTRIGMHHLDVVPSAIDFGPIDDLGVAAAVGVREPYLLYAGSYEPRKNLVGLLRGYDRYVAKGGTCALIAITERESGHEPAARRVLDALGARDRVHLAHDLDDRSLRALYTGARALVFPSRAEGLGLPPLQAAACGVPVVISTLPVLVETVGSVAVTADACDVDDLARALVVATTDPAIRERAAVEGPRIAARYRPDVCAARHIDIYRSCRTREHAAA